MVLLRLAFLVHEAAVDDVGAVAHVGAKWVELVEEGEPLSVPFLQQEQRVVVHGAPDLLDAIDLGVYQVVDGTAAMLVIQGEMLLDEEAGSDQVVPQAPDVSAVNGDKDAALLLDVEDLQHRRSLLLSLEKLPGVRDLERGAWMTRSLPCDVPIHR